MTRRRDTLLATAAVLALAVLATACVGRADFDDDVRYADVERALGAGALEVCATTTDDEGLANQALDTRTYVVALDCGSDDQVRLVVDRFDDEDARDAAARQFEVLLRPKGDGAVWTWGPFTLFANGARDDDVMEQLRESLDERGAA